MRADKIIGVMCAIMLGTATVGETNDIEVDFDGVSTNNQTISMDDMIKTLPVMERILPDVSVLPNEQSNEAMLYKLNRPARRALCNYISADTTTSFSTEIRSVINDDRVEVVYNNSVVLFVNTINNEKYNTLVESKDDRLIHLLSELNKKSLPQSKQLEEVTVCGLVSVVVVHYLWKIIDNVWTQVAVETIELVKQCHIKTDESTDNSPIVYGGPISWPVRKATRH